MELGVFKLAEFFSEFPRIMKLHSRVSNEDTSEEKHRILDKLPSLPRVIINNQTTDKNKVGCVHFGGIAIEGTIIISGKASSFPHQLFIFHQSVFRHQLVQLRTIDSLAQEDTKIRELGNPRGDRLGS